MNRIELLTSNIPHVAQWANRSERERWVRIVKTWQKKQPDATVEATALFESWLWLHVLEQRLRDNRVFFDGTDTSMCGDSLPADDLERKQRELDKWLPVIVKNKLEVMKLALASSVNLSITGDTKSVTDLIRATRNLQGKECQQ
jgi:hypothetical protein